MRNNSATGPYTAAALKAFAAAGKIRGTDLIRKGRDGKPVPASSVKGLFPRESSVATGSSDIRLSPGPFDPTVEWYYGKDGNRFGPVAWSQLRGFADTRQLLPSDLVWREGLADWVPAAKIEGLFALVDTTIPAAMSPPPINSKQREQREGDRAIDHTQPPDHFFVPIGDRGIGQVVPSGVLQNLSHPGFAIGLTILALFLLVLAHNRPFATAVAFGLALLLYWDATANKVGLVRPRGWFTTNMSAGMWATMSLLLWPIILPSYLISRPRLVHKAQDQPREPGARNVKLGVLGALGLLFFLGSFGDQNTGTAPLAAPADGAMAGSQRAQPDTSPATTRIESVLDTHHGPSDAPSASAPPVTLANGRVLSVAVIRALKEQYGRRCSIGERLATLDGTQYEPLVRQMGGSAGYIGSIEHIASQDQTTSFLFAENDAHQLVGVYCEVTFDPTDANMEISRPWIGLQDAIDDLFPKNDYVMREILAANASGLMIGQAVIRTIGTATVALSFSSRNKRLAILVTVAAKDGAQPSATATARSGASRTKETPLIVVMARFAKALGNIPDGETDLAGNRGTIDADRRLTLVREMGYLDPKKLHGYLEMKRRMGREWEGFPANTCFIMLLPSKEWPKACRRLGISPEMYRLCVGLVVKSTGVPEDKVSAAVEEMTGESLDSY
jgi:hypothetical protein